MSEHHRDKMLASTARRRNAKHEPDVYGFRGDALAELGSALDLVADHPRARLLVRLGRKADGNPEAWLDVRDGDGEMVGCYNVSFTCPPRPPEDCEE